MRQFDFRRDDDSRTSRLVMYEINYEHAESILISALPISFRSTQANSSWSENSSNTRQHLQIGDRRINFDSAKTAKVYNFKRSLNALLFCFNNRAINQRALIFIYTSKHFRARCYLFIKSNNYSANAEIYLFNFFVFMLVFHNVYF